MSDESLRTHPNFKANLPSHYMTPTAYIFHFPQDRSFNHYVAYASKSLGQLPFWQAKRIRFFQFQFNFLKPTQHDLNTNPNDITTTKLHLQIYQLFLEKKQPQNFIFQIHKFTSPFSYHTNFSLNHLFIIGTIRNYDHDKQLYILTTYHDPTRPLFVRQEALNVNDDFILPTHIPTAVPNFFSKNELITSLYPSNNSEEIIQSLPKHNPPSTISDPTTVPPPTFLPPPASFYVLQTANTNVCINSFSCPTDRSVSEIFNSSPSTC